MDENALMLQEARRLAEDIASSLPEHIQAAALTLKSKLPFKALSVRELLIHRVSPLATAAVEHFERNQNLPAIVLTRAVVETVAVLYSLHQRLKRFLDDENSSELDVFLMRCLLGSRNQSQNHAGLPEAINVLTLVDRVEKEFPGFRSMYDDLCEFTHPNWAGTHGSFGKHKGRFELELGPTETTVPWTMGVTALANSLRIFHHYYNDSANLLQQLNDHFEHRVDPRAPTARPPTAEGTGS
jgi:hypothetical protein